MPLPPVRLPRAPPLLPRVPNPRRLVSEQGDLERSEKRLKSLQAVRPAFMDDLEKLEGELKKNYEL